MSKLTPKKFMPVGWIVAVAALAALGVALAAFAGSGSPVSNSHRRTSAATVAPRPASTARTAAPLSQDRVKAKYAALPLAFEKNEGQADPQIQYVARGKGYTLFLTSGDAVLSLASGSSSSTSRPKEIMENRLPGYSLKTKKLIRRRRPLSSAKRPSVASLRVHLLNGNDQGHISAEDLLPSRVNYFIGNDPHKWHKDVSEFARVTYKDVYPGVNLDYHGHENQLEFDFIVAPGANPSPIAVSFPGAHRLATDKLGNLVLASSVGDLTLHKPVAYQEHDGLRQTVDARFVLQADHVRFDLGNYDHNRELVIDPQLSYASYLGGNGDDEGFGIAADSNGNSYITGESNSTAGFPGVSPSFGGFDAFVVKINADGSLGYTTLVGGSGDDLAGAITVDTNGAVYVAGITTSTDFPTSPGAPQTTSGGGGSCTTGNGSGTCTDGFAFKLDTTGATVYSTYIAGTNDDGAFGIAVDGAGNAYVTGFTFSSDFPLANAAYPVLNNNVASNPVFEDGFVTEINAAGTAWVYSTYLGGKDNDFGNGITVDSAGDAFVTGATSSTDFPVTSGAYKTTCGTDGSCNTGSGNIFTDVFVTEIPAGGGQLAGATYSTYIGGSSDEFGLGIALDTSGNAYVTGQTTDDNLAAATGDFPVTTGAFQQNYGGGSGNANASGNAFVTKLNSNGTALVYSSYLGGSTSDAGFGIALDSANDAYVTGSTMSSDFPANNGFQTALGGTSDAFVTEVSSNGGSLIYSSYLGGTGDENFDATTNTFIGAAIAVDSSNNVHLAGTTTSSSDFPVSGTAVQPSYGGDPFDAFAATVLSTTAPEFTIAATTPAAVSAGTSGSSTVTLTAVNGYALPVNLACSVSGGGTPAPACGTSSFSPNPLTPSASGATSNLTITTTGASAALYRPSSIFYAMWLPIVGLSLVGIRCTSPLRRKKKLLGFLLLGLIMAALFFLPACGGSSNNGGGGGGCTGCTPAGNYTVTVTGTDSNNQFTHAVDLGLTVN